MEIQMKQMLSAACSLLFLLITTTTLWAQLAGAPPPFDGSKKLKVALVQLLVEGEFMQTFRSGAKRQAEMLGMEFLALNTKNADNKAQADAVDRAISLGVDAILLSHGRPETMREPIQRALAQGIKVVAFDIYFEDLTNIVTHMAQDDVLLGQMALDALVADFNGQANVGYIYIPGVLPLDKRDTSFTKVKQEYPGIKEIARHGSLESPISTKNADQVKATMQANRNINAYFAPYDEFAKGVVIALRELNMSDKVKVYSADISTVDIRQMTQDGSPWAATAATNPAAIGATGIRALAMKLTGEWLPKEITIPPMLFTQKMLRDNNVQRFNDLFEKFPEFNTVDRASATWIPRDSSGKF